MTQTVNGQNKTPQRRSRPGQRQQERLMRQMRRNRRRRIWITSIAAAVLIAAGITGLVSYERYTAQQTEAANKIRDQHATATANVHATGTAIVDATATGQANAKATAEVHATGTAVAKVILTATNGTPVPTAGPATPPSVSGSPIKMADGLQYIDIKEGSGAVAKEGSTVTVEYTGWLQSDGKKFDSSYDRGAQPFDVTPLGQAQVIPGWNKGLVGMKVGGTRRLIIGPDLAYGAAGSPPVIPANATLIFDVTVIAVK
jgi:peptidylprolyl isomerase